MIGDIFLATFIFEVETDEATFGIHYREVVEPTGTDTGPQALATALDLALTTALVECLSNDGAFAAIFVNKLHDLPEAPYRFDLGPSGVGQRTGPSLPDDNALVLGLNQSTFDQRSNGRIFVPLIPEGNTLPTNGGAIDVTLRNFYQAFTAILINDISEETPGAGEWEPGVLSRKILDLSPPAKDWDGAFGRLMAITSGTIIGSQSRRGTQVRASV